MDAPLQEVPNLLLRTNKGPSTRPAGSPKARRRGSRPPACLMPFSDAAAPPSAAPSTPLPHEGGCPQHSQASPRSRPRPPCSEGSPVREKAPPRPGPGGPFSRPWTGGSAGTSRAAVAEAAAARGRGGGRGRGRGCHGVMRLSSSQVETGRPIGGCMTPPPPPPRLAPSRVTFAIDL